MVKGIERLVMLAIVVAASLSAIGPASALAGIRPTQDLVVLDGPHEARSAPSSHARAVVLVPERTPITAIRTVLPVLERRGAWIKVSLPGRPNGRVGWISAGTTSRSTTAWHVVVDLATRRVTTYRNGRPVRSFESTVGASATPTPTGEFFVEESVALAPSRLGAPYALALSARSTVYRTFDGGPGQIALHGLINDDSSTGSHGCVRLESAAIGWLVRHVGPGSPVTIVA
jgi:L,D-transpeptidase catalytic domain